MVGDAVMSERPSADRHVTTCLVEDRVDDYPCKIPAGQFGATVDTYLSKGHAIKFDGRFWSPASNFNKLGSTPSSITTTVR